MNNDLAHKYDGHKNKKCLNKAINSFHHMELIYDNSCSFNCKEIALFSLVLQKEFIECADIFIFLIGKMK